MGKKHVTMVRITEENFMFLASKIKRFMENDLVAWHNFDCGSKRHIQQDISFEGIDDGLPERVSTVVRYAAPEIDIECPKYSPNYPKHLKPFIRMRLAQGYGGIIKIGDWVGFTGNRMHLKMESLPHFHKWEYDVYQRWDPNGGFKDERPACDNFYDEMDDYDWMP